MTVRTTQQRWLKKAGMVPVSVGGKHGWVPSEYAGSMRALIRSFEMEVARITSESPKRGAPRKGRIG